MFKVLSSLKFIADTVRKCLFSIVCLALAVILIEGIYRDKWNIEVISLISDAQRFFNSELGGPLVAPILAVFGLLIGLFTASPSKGGAAFWLDIFNFSASGLIFVWVLIQVTPPTSPVVARIFEAYGMDSESESLNRALSVVVISLSAWLANRMRTYLKIEGPEKENEKERKQRSD